MAVTVLGVGQVPVGVRHAVVPMLVHMLFGDHEGAAHHHERRRYKERKGWSAAGDDQRDHGGEERPRSEVGARAGGAEVAESPYKQDEAQVWSPNGGGTRACRLR